MSYISTPQQTSSQIQILMNACIDENRANSWGDLFLQQADQNGISVNDLQKCPASDIVSLAIKMKHTMISEGKWLSPEIGFSPVAEMITCFPKVSNPKIDFTINLKSVSCFMNFPSVVY